VVGAWPRVKSMQRALRYDGLLPNVFGEKGNIRMGPPSTDEIRQMKEYIAANRHQDTPFDIVIEGQTPGSDLEKAGEIVNPYLEAGATWWIEALWDIQDAYQVLTRIQQGPPRSE
jgi:hypothetical protein